VGQLLGGESDTSEARNLGDVDLDGHGAGW
jgi:hypothetical protein